MNIDPSFTIEHLGNASQVITRFTDGTKYFHSYGRHIATLKDNRVYITPYWSYSNTTLKYFKIAFGLSHCTKAQIVKAIKFTRNDTEQYIDYSALPE